MKIIKFLSILSLGYLYIRCCPSESEIEPCLCVNPSPEEISISCVGEDINDEIINAILELINLYLFSSPHTVLRLFRLQKTSLTLLSEDVFGSVPFIELEIYDNSVLNLANLTANTLFASIYTLKSFYASNNNLYDSDGSDLILVFNNFVFLQYLTIKENRMERILRKTFKNEEQIHLKAIDLSSNRISSVEEYAFFELLNLEYLNLSNNSLLQLSPYSLALSQWSSVPLQVLLNSNELSANILSEELFSQKNIKRPLILFLQNNKMQFLAENVFRPIVENEKNLFIDFMDNSLHCDCERHKWLFLLSKHLRLKLLNLHCGKQSLWEFESLVFKNCFND